MTAKDMSDREICWDLIPGQWRYNMWLQKGSELNHSTISGDKKTAFKKKILLAQEQQEKKKENH